MNKGRLSGDREELFVEESEALCREMGVLWCDGHKIGYGKGKCLYRCKYDTIYIMFVIEDSSS